MSRRVVVEARAKINLSLSVGARRPDGYHEISSVMQSVSLSDRVTLTQAAELSLTVDPPGAAPEDESNLVVAAMRAVRAAFGARDGAGVLLEKRIPVAAGLGGGSADAAATLAGLKALWKLAVSRKALEKVGASIGSDVPFCVRGGTAVARGRGEILSPVPSPRAMWWVIVAPDAALSTAAVYSACRGGEASEPFELVDALARGDLEGVASSMHNDLQDVAGEMEPAVRECVEWLRNAGALGAMMSGSGPSCIGLAESEEHARSIAAAVAAPFVHVAHSTEDGARLIEQSP